MANPHRHAHVDDPVEFGRRLKELRLGRGMSQRDLSFLGCTAVYICRIERGDRVPSLQVIVELARRLETTPEYLARGGKSRQPPFVVELDAAELDEAIRGYGFHSNGNGLAGLDDLTPDEVERLRAQIRQDAQTLAGPLAAAIIAYRDYPVGTA